MIANINKEYTAPSKAKCKVNADRIKKQTEAFLAKGGSIEKVASDLEVTDAHQKTKAKRDAARRRGMNKMKKEVAA